MKKTFLFGALLCTIGINAQITVFSETFDSTAINALPTGWSALDRDGNGSNWSVKGAPFSGLSGNICASNDSSPDNVLITPSISLPSAGSLTLSYLTGTYQFASVFPFDNHYAVYVLPAASTFTGTEIPVFEETVSAGNVALSKTVNLSGYAGQNVKIYYRHFNSPDKGVFILDTVKITRPGTLGTAENVSENKTGVYPNPATDYIYIRSKANAVEVFDASGKKLPVHFDGEKADVRSLQPGTYLISIETKEGKTTEKFIKK